MAQQERPRICPFMSIATVGKAPSAIVNPIDESAQGIQPVGCAGLDCMLFVPFRDEKSGKITGGNCAVTQVAMAITILQQALSAPAAKG